MQNQLILNQAMLVKCRAEKTVHVSEDISAMQRVSAENVKGLQRTAGTLQYLWREMPC